MIKITIISYYELKESLLLASEALKRKGYQINYYPLFKYMYDKYDRKENYLTHFNDFLKDDNPDIILWWYLNIPTSDFQSLLEGNSYYNILYNWDDPWNWTDINIDLKGKAKNFNLIVASCEESLEDYIKYGSKAVLYLPPGFQEYQTNDILEDYQCDISICCTNLYENEKLYNDQYINRKLLIDKIYQDKNIKFYIYGPDFLKNLYPNSYRGFIKYHDLPKVIINSKINLCTHVCSSKSKYINERSCLVIGYGGFLFVDKVKDLDKIIEPNKECMFIEKNNELSQIYQILELEKQPDSRYWEIRKNALLKSKQYTWDQWATKLHNKISESFQPRKIEDKENKFIIKNNDDSKITNEIIIKLNSKFINLNQSLTYSDLKKELYNIEKIINNNPYIDINGELRKFNLLI